MEADAKTCNQTRSNHCINGICMCGSNTACSQTNHITELANCNEDDCGNTPSNGICGCKWEPSSGSCKIARTDKEVCQQITQFYNPLYIKDALMHDGENIILCDDIIGKKENIGQYFCMGN